MTGIFAFAGGLYTWGEGNIFIQDDLLKVLIPWADIILTGPLSVACGIGILKEKPWGRILGLSACGIYIFGSLMVFITMIWNNSFELYLVVPAVSGALIGLGYIAVQLFEPAGYLAKKVILPSAHHGEELIRKVPAAVNY